MLAVGWIGGRGVEDHLGEAPQPGLLRVWEMRPVRLGSVIDAVVGAEPAQRTDPPRARLLGDLPVDGLYDGLAGFAGAAGQEPVAAVGPAHHDRLADETDDVDALDEPVRRQLGGELRVEPRPCPPLGSVQEGVAGRGTH